MAASSHALIIEVLLILCLVCYEVLEVIPCRVLDIDLLPRREEKETCRGQKSSRWVC